MGGNESKPKVGDVELPSGEHCKPATTVNGGGDACIHCKAAKN